MYLFHICQQLLNVIDVDLNCSRMQLTDILDYLLHSCFTILGLYKTAITNITKTAQTCVQTDYIYNKF